MKATFVISLSLLGALAFGQSLYWQDSGIASTTTRYAGSTVNVLNANGGYGLILKQCSAATGALLTSSPYSYNVQNPSMQTLTPYGALAADTSNGAYFGYKIVDRQYGTSYYLQKAILGSLKWNTQIGGDIFGIGVSGNTVFVGYNKSTSAYLEALNATTGAVLSGSAATFSGVTGASLWVNSSGSACYAGGSGFTLMLDSLQGSTWSSSLASFPLSAPHYNPGSFVSIAGDSTGVYVTGLEIYAPNTGPVNATYAMKADLNLNKIWEQHIQNISGNNAPGAIAVDGSTGTGNVYYASYGYYGVGPTFIGNQLYSASAATGSSAMIWTGVISAQTNAQIFAMTATPSHIRLLLCQSPGTLPAAGGVFGITPTGAVTWSYVQTGQFSYSLDEDSSGNVYFSGPVLTKLGD